MLSKRKWIHNNDAQDDAYDDEHKTVISRIKKRLTIACLKDQTELDTNKIHNLAFVTQVFTLVLL